MDLMDRARELGTEADSWVKIAFNEILANIYACELKEGELDKLIEDMAYYAMEKLDIKEEDFNWQSIEDWQTKEQYSLANYYIEDFSEVKKIISKAKVLRDDWEDIESKEMPIKKINQKMLENFKEDIDGNMCCYSKEEMINRFNFIEK